MYARRTGADAEDASDLVQGFLLSIWERDDLRTLSPERGRFRSFLLAALAKAASFSPASSAAEARCSGRRNSARRDRAGPGLDGFEPGQGGLTFRDRMGICQAY